MKHPEFPISSLLAAFVMIPLPWHWRTKNIAAVSIICWLFTVDVIYCINSLIWADNVRNSVPVWCDISTKLVIGALYALPISAMCICKHLADVSSFRKMTFDLTDRRRRTIFESLMCFVLPLVFMGLHYTVQDHRFDILENTGCQTTVYVSVPSASLIWLPQLCFSITTAAYAFLAIRNFIQQRQVFTSHLQSSDSTLTKNSYLRLIAMTITQTVLAASVAAFNLHLNMVGRLQPWTRRTEVHNGFSRVGIYPEASISSSFRQYSMLLWWTMPVSSFLFFIFFALGAESKNDYGMVLSWCRALVSRRSPCERKSTSNSLSPRDLELLETGALESARRDSFLAVPSPVTFSTSSSSAHHTYFTPAPSPTKIRRPISWLRFKNGESPTDRSDTATISTFIADAQPYDVFPCHSSIQVPAPVITRLYDDPPQLPEIPISPNLSPPHSPRLSLSESVDSTFYSESISRSLYNRPTSRSSVHAGRFR